MTAWICRTCGVQHPDTGQPPSSCAICDDERQYVGWGGQRWTTMDELAADHAVVVREEEPGLSASGSSRRSPSGSARCWSPPRRATCSGTASPCWTRPPGGSPSSAASTRSACRTRTSMPATSSSPTRSTRGSSSRAPTGSGSAPVAAHRAVRRRGRAGSRPDARQHRRALRRRGGAALASRVGRPGGAADRRHHHRHRRTATG